MLYWKRYTSVEPVPFRRFSLRGLEQGKGELDLMSIAHNLNVLFNLIAKDCFRFIIFLQYYRNYCRILLANLEFMLIVRAVIKNI